MIRAFSVLVLLLVSIIILSGMGSKDDVPLIKEGSKIKVVGVLRLVGNEPFTRFSIRVTQKTNFMDIYLPNDLKKTHNNLIAREVEAEGIFHTEIIYSADHKYKIREYQLSNVTILRKMSSKEE